MTREALILFAAVFVTVGALELLGFLGWLLLGEP